ncbi:hypothetical protein EVD33_10895 [Bacteroidales bacterium SW292]|nr:hypothetical protein [Bacteroidales bacterium SW292]
MDIFPRETPKESALFPTGMQEASPFTHIYLSDSALLLTYKKPAPKLLEAGSEAPSSRLQRADDTAC